MIRKQTNELTIRPKISSTVMMALVVIGLFTFAIATYFAYSAGISAGHSQFNSDKVLITELKGNIEELKSDLLKVQESFTFAQRQQQIQEEAYKQLSKAYSNSEEKNSVLGSRLDFYRSIISPESGQTGPAIQSLNHVYSDAKLDFDVTLVQAIKHKHQVQGNLKVILFENDAPTKQWPLTSSRSVNYQYFQQISGSFEAPQLSENTKIKVELSLSTGEKIERWFVISKQDVS